MRTTFILSTVNLQVNGNNEYGYMNITKTSMIFKNLNFRVLLGKLYDKYKKYNIKLVQVTNNTALILNFTPTVPKIFFTMENYNGNTLFNIGDYANYGNGTLVNPTNIYVTASDKINGTYSLYNVSSYVTVPAFSYPNDFGVGVSFCGWFKTTGTNGEYPSLFDNDNYCLFIRESGAMQYRYKGDLTFQNIPNSTYTPTVWNHFCLTHAIDGTVNMYINNVLERTGIVPYVTTNGGTFRMLYGPYTIGGPTQSVTFKGWLDDFRYYNTILTDEERGYIYTNIFPQDGDYDDIDSCMNINVGSLPFVNRGNGRTTMALCKMEQSQNNIISNVNVECNKMNDIGEISIDMVVDISTNQISTNLLSNTSFLFEVEGITQ